MTKKADEDNYDFIRGWVWKLFLGLTTLFIVAVASQLPQIEQNRIINERQEVAIEKMQAEMTATGKATVRVLTEISTTVKVMEKQGVEENKIAREQTKILQKTITEQAVQSSIIDSFKNHLDNDIAHK